MEVSSFLQAQWLIARIHSLNTFKLIKIQELQKASFVFIFYTERPGLSRDY